VLEARRVEAERREAERAAAVERAARAEAESLRGAADWAPADPNDCAGYFGNGFEQRSVLLAAAEDDAAGAAAAPLVSCARNPATTAALCDFRRVIMHPERVRMTAGGEKLEAVMGRSEEEELPRLQPGFLEAVARGYETAVRVAPGTLALEGAGGAAGAPAEAAALRDKVGVLGQHLDQADRYKRELLLSLAVVRDAAASPRVCAQRVRATVVLVTRMEYANLFHTSTDWYNVWSAARAAGLAPTLDFVAEGLTPRSAVTPHTASPKFNAHVVFLDGHNAGPMDEGWLALFVSASYAKHFEGPTCFDRVVYAPFGYAAAISSGIQPRQTQCRTDPNVRRFSDDFVRGLGIAPRAHSSCGGHDANGGPGAGAGGDAPATTKVVFVQRTHYLAHPRHNGKIVRRLDNEDEIVQGLTAAAAGGEAGVALLRGVFSEMTLREQVKVAQEACVIAGAHGAGLSHVLFAPPGVHLLELQPPAFARPHFIAYAFWSGAHHHNWPLDSSTPSVHAVVTRVFETARHAAVEALAEAGMAQGADGGARAGGGRGDEHGAHPLHGG